MFLKYGYMQNEKIIKTGLNKKKTTHILQVRREKDVYRTISSEMFHNFVVSSYSNR